MAANFNTDLDLNNIALIILGSAYGLEFICVLVVIFVLVASIYFIAKSGFISSLREHSEHRRKKRNELITDQEKLLDDKFLTEFSSDLEYHIKVSKLENYLNIKNRDIDLLKYILSCRNKDKAVKLYKIGKEYLEKDNLSNNYKLKPKYTVKRLKFYENFGTFIYFTMNALGAVPYIVLSFLNIFYKEYRLAITSDLLYLAIFFFIGVFVFSMFVLWGFLKPEAAKNFLELEKIDIKQRESNDLNRAA